MVAARTSPLFSTSLTTVRLIVSVARILEPASNRHTELSIAPQLNHQLVPAHIKPTLASKGLDIDNIQPLTKDQMMARLD